MAFMTLQAPPISLEGGSMNQEDGSLQPARVLRRSSFKRLSLRNDGYTTILEVKGLGSKQLLPSLYDQNLELWWTLPISTIPHADGDDARFPADPSGAPGCLNTFPHPQSLRTGSAHAAGFPLFVQPRLSASSFRGQLLVVKSPVPNPRPVDEGVMRASQGAAHLDVSAASGMTKVLMQSQIASLVLLVPQNISSVTEFILLGFSGETQVRMTLFTFFFLLYLITLLGNGLIVTLIYLDSCLHTPMYFFLSILSLVDMSYVTTTMPQMLVNMVSPRRTISWGACTAQMFIFLVLGIAECVLYAIMAYDRYVAICFPLHYTLFMSSPICIKMVTMCLSISMAGALVYTVFTMHLPYCGPYKINHFFCEVPAVLKLACADTSFNDHLDFILGFILLLVPLSLILASYVCIFAAIFRIHSSQGRLKSFSTCASHITVVTMFYGPAMIMYMRPSSWYDPERDKKLALFYNVVSAFLNPIIYSLRNKDVKVAFLKVLRHRETC
ncbi:olfactory receptor 2A12-like [Nycticebus coucang]|uniref:olfactory receptor 2A12-like n=1 Tax=Nycticebus coucang TaxID=9470 RepID=UPI00234CC977|nr:olfactory receptor 2A12-like [Nycticebus coucang]